MTNETPTDFADLIARLEKATGPDRELDAAIYRDVVRNGRATNHDALSPAQRAAHFRSLAPEFTYSIDAGLMLVPENHRWTVSSDEFDGAGDPLLPSAFVGRFGADYSHDQFTVAATAAIALCIATLKARKAENG